MLPQNVMLVMGGKAARASVTGKQFMQIDHDTIKPVVF